MSAKFEVILVKDAAPLLDGVFVREEGELEWLVRLNPHAFANEQDQVSCGNLIANFLTQVQSWS